MKFDFTLQLTDHTEATDELANKLYSTNQDWTLSSRMGFCLLNVTKEAESLKDAIDETIQDLEKIEIKAKSFVEYVEKQKLNPVCNYNNSYWRTNIGLTTKSDLQDEDVLMWYDGPLQYYRRLFGVYYHYMWANQEGNIGTWMVHETTEENLLKLLNCDLSLNQFYDVCDNVYLAITDKSDDIENFVKIDKAPEEYRATQDDCYLLYGEGLAEINALKVK